ncbi:helix-turn-helix domain-containing protein [Planktothrix paucivesiculata]|uniref:XRE family transcriptional regulator n=1 Tax=Planktothrix paucivesiculata PCC 9631 TaxID=671071 RepID=A0A7Z9C4B7_9CYAN|nr:helix-turn-helix transcriptional regulator [Planktothrix paucivesiculata]VXD25537.1 XRE family transcriptional regulator [Planktothrix paucivesiculata PCC 9631]
MTLAKVFGKVLKQRREALNLSQEELAFEAGLHRTYISLLERGVKSPTLNVLFRLAEALDIPPSQFIQKIEVQLKTLELYEDSED